MGLLLRKTPLVASKSAVTGVCLLEALTGKRAFHGDNASLVLASVLKDEPDFDALPSTTPAIVRRLLRRCLEKKRERRLRDIGDARLEIEEALLAPAPANAQVPTVSRRTRRRPWVALTAAVLAAIAGKVGLWRLHGADPSRLG